eukprot:CAMPEP_0171299940 /NCGR_PEP_ID=MMETSP0816-20121228/8813_1 /TAXON_ID=420281 /ORGANISM="Proboscia inermis, Strain CCAP1064/1" /LENGTH=131 /DNA_ID=CAMNT_0011776157 /DNA_START=358 /DNA_END=753 /DNA_ORIENTATION=+
MMDKNDSTSAASTPPSNATPFFASTTSEFEDAKREKVIKSTDENSGKVTTDGELMAKLSESEEWTTRSLTEVFEVDETMPSMSPEDVAKKEKMKRLAERDLGASIYGLRKSLQNEDFRKIFPKKNYYIGEE